MRALSITTLVLLAALPVGAQPALECQLPGQALTSTPDCEGLTGTTLVSCGDAFIDAAPNGLGFPAQGAQYLRVPGNNVNVLVAAVPCGGPVTRPIDPGYNEVQIPIPPGATDVKVTWDFYNADAIFSGYNDGVSIDVVDPATGLSILNVAYADVDCTPLAPSAGIDAISSGTDTNSDGPETSCAFLPPLPPGAYLSVACWQDGDDACGGFASHCVVDDVQWNTGCVLPTPNMPNSAAATLFFSGTSCLPSATFPMQRLLAPSSETLMTVSTLTNGQQSYALFATVGVGTAVGPGLSTMFGVVDLDVPTIFGGGLIVVIDGIGGLSLLDSILGNTGPGGSRVIPLTLPASGSGTWASFQGICVDPPNPFGLLLTAATQIDLFGGIPPLPPAFTGATPVPGVLDDSTTQIVFTSGLLIPFYGTVYTDVWVNSNGNLTLSAGDIAYAESVGGLQSGFPRIAPLWNDFSPNIAGTVAYTETATSLVVSWVGVPEYQTLNTNDFGVSIDSLGNIVMSWGQVDSGSGLVGISPGAFSPVGAATGASQDLSANAAGGIIGAPTDAIFELFGLFDLNTCLPGGPGAPLTFQPNLPMTVPGDMGYTAF